MFELYMTVPDHTKETAEINAGAMIEEFIFASNRLEDITAYLDIAPDGIYGDFTEIRIVRK